MDSRLSAEERVVWCRIAHIGLIAMSAILFFAAISVKGMSASPPITRRDGFLLIWQSILRATVDAKHPFVDVRPSSAGYREITYAKSRGIFSEGDNDATATANDASFRPDAPLTVQTALLWLLRTRSIEPVDLNGKTKFLKTVERGDLLKLTERYKLPEPDSRKMMSKDELLGLMRTLDESLAKEQHEVSLYSELFNGKGTAFGETFDMYALTAAHRSYPYNTLVKVTNVDNGKSVVVRINDRGPFVQGRDMDLSLGAFTTIAERSKGKIMATFERLGDVGLANHCTDSRFQRRITRNVVLTPGIPHFLALGKTLSLKSKEFFVVRSILYPDGTRNDDQSWISPEEGFTFTPSITGTYHFIFDTKEGNRRDFSMEVVDCSQSNQNK